MKTERRHELQQNELADWLGDSVRTAKPYWRALLGVTLAIVILLVCYYLISGNTARKETRAWDAYLTALSASTPQGVQDDLAKVIEEYPKANAGHAAQVALADLQLNEGINGLFVNRSDGEKKLQSAIDHYKDVLSKTKESLLWARATFGLARAQESLGKLDEALKNYESVANTTTTRAYADLAKARVVALNKPSTKAWYAWFAEQKPVAIPPSSLPGTPGERMPFDDRSLDPSNTKLFDLNDPAKLLGDTSAPADLKLPGDDLKSGDDTKSSDGPVLPKLDTEAEKITPEGAKGDSTKSDDATPDSAKSDDAKPDATKSDATKSDSAKSDTTKSDEKAADGPQLDAKKTDSDGK